MRPLDGITVVSLEHAVAAPFCTRQLADYGARVVKIERPGSGDFARAYDTTVHGQASHFVWLNRGKESVALDLKQPQAREVLEKLIAQADVLVQNLAPGATARMGLDFAALSARYPRLIVADVSGYGDDGPFRDKKAYDLLIQAEAGLIGITGSRDAPAKAGISVADIAAGMYAYSGILLALIRRGQTGRGTRVEVSMLEALSEWMGYALYFGHYGGRPPARNGASHAAIAPYGPHRAGDGLEVIFGLQNEREWATFCAEVLGQPALSQDPRFASNSARVQHRPELTRLIEAAFAGLTAEAVIGRLDAAGIASGRMNGIEQVVAHPQLLARERFRQVGGSAGSIWALLPPANLSGVEAAMGDVPALGEHTEATLRSLGYGADQIAALRARRAI
ncbi:MAG: CaiB/BaiF CoA-transferase family protein [Myxococcales bacterium]